MFKDIFDLKETENGALAFKSTGSKCLDLFSRIGALREVDDDDEIKELFKGAYKENMKLTYLIALYARDINFGLGERMIFRKFLEFVVNKPEFLETNIIQMIGTIGRFDDILSLLNHNDKVDKEVICYLANKLKEDLKTEYPSLLAKWLPSVTKPLAKQLIKLFNKYNQGDEYLTSKKYRQTLSFLRKKLDIIETKLCEKRYEDIDYSKVPSKAMMNYRTAFYRNDSVRFQEYLEKIQSGELKMKNRLYPYEIYRALKTSIDETSINVLEEQWKALPDFIDNHSAIVLADVSGSMSGTPMMMSVSLALYFAERNKSEAFKNIFLTFSSNPTFETIKGENLKEKFDMIENVDWGGSTNLYKAYCKILERAKNLNVKPDEMPEFLIVISDMEIDEADDSSLHQNKLETLFENSGYNIPKLIFWNVNSRNSTFLQKDNCILVSGASINVFKGIFENDGDPYKYMIKVLETYLNERILKL